MKFAWKICFSTIFVSIVIFSIGGYALMSEMFRATYQREIHNASEENEILRYSFVTYWNTAAVNFNIGEENVEKTAEAMLRAMRESSVRMRISDESGKILFDNAKTTADMDILKSINEKVQGHCLKKTETGYELQTVGAIRTEQGEVLYLETVRDVSDIFKERDAQYGIYLRWMAGMLLIESVCCYGMARWLLRPLKRLSKASGRIAGGDLHIRAEIQTRDEIGELAADFNHMAENLEKQFLELEEAAKKQEVPWNLMLVNGTHFVEDGYEPKLAEVENNYMVDARIVKDLQAMLRDGRRAGMNFWICSAYRSMEKQIQLYDNKVKRLQGEGMSFTQAQLQAGKEVAYPGTSEHHLGLAVDIVAKDYQLLDDKQADTKEAKWLKENCWRYGFILRYPLDKTEETGIVFEPWHYRYVGIEAAKEIMEQGICLEEYLETLYGDM